MYLTSWISFVIIGTTMGFLSGFLGIGGGFIIVPLLISIGVSTHTAIGSTQMYMVLTGFSGTIQHLRQNDCNIKLALPMLCSGMITVYIGAIVSSYCMTSTLELILSILLFGLSIRMMLAKDTRIGIVNKCTFNYPENIPISVLIGLVVGFLSGLLGVGGGFLLVPLMCVLLRVPIPTAIGTSLLVVTGFGASGSISHWIIGDVDLSLAGTLALGGIVFAPIGAIVNKKFTPKQLQNLICIVLLFFGVELLIRYILQ